MLIFLRLAIRLSQIYERDDWSCKWVFFIDVIVFSQRWLLRWEQLEKKDMLILFHLESMLYVPPSIQVHRTFCLRIRGWGNKSFKNVRVLTYQIKQREIHTYTIPKTYSGFHLTIKGYIICLLTHYKSFLKIFSLKSDYHLPKKFFLFA